MIDMSKKTGWIPTNAGRKIDYLDPQPDQIEIMDIARGLASESRWAGQTDHFYSVAQHSVFVSLIVPREFQLEALLHDAAEAFCKDIPRPLKLLIPGYKLIEQKVDAAIRQRFGLPPTLSKEVEDADRIMLATERRDLMPNADLPPETISRMAGFHPWMKRIYAANPEKALGMFCRRWMELQRSAIGAAA